MSRTSPSAKAAPEAPADGLLHGRAKNAALAAIFLSIFVSMLASTVVGSSMPLIIADLGGGQAAYTWVITGTMLATAISTPIWGKLADLSSKKLLLQLALVIFTLGTILAGFAPDANWLIGFRVLQGLGGGGLAALGQIVMADIISPRERGKYMGVMGAVMAVPTIGGPLLGGVITDAFGWRWNFFVAVPVAIVAIIILQKSLHLVTLKRKVKIDYFGAVLISAGFSSLLIWATLGGSQFDWWSWQTLAMAGGGVVALIAAVFVELNVEEPMIPLSLFKNRTFTMAVIASLAVGVAMFGTAIFLGQYMQLARGKTPTESGLLTIPMMLGLLVASTIVGQIISRTGKWKRYVVLGAILMGIGLTLMGQLRSDTSFWYVGISMAVLGAGVGMCMQNLVLVVQNTVSPTEIGVASSSVTFFRTIGGTAGMSVLGAMLGTQVIDFIASGLKRLSPDQLAGVEALQGGTIPKVAELPLPIREVVEAAYGHAIGDIFFAAVPLALVALIAICFLPNIPLGTKTTSQLLAEKAGAKSTATGSIATIEAAAADLAATELAADGFTEMVSEELGRVDPAQAGEAATVSGSVDSRE